jgi:hypothetical protein
MARRRCPASFVCKGCGAITVRRPSPARDTRRMYCSQACQMRVWWRTHEKLVYPPLQSTVQRKTAEADRRRVARIEQQIERLHWLQASTIRFCLCGAMITRRYGRLCNACAAQRKTVAQHQALEARRTDGVVHVCPNCGRTFHGRDQDIHCSSRCAHHLHKKGRYPTIGTLPIGERNRIASLIALVRAANRRMDEVAKSL